MLTGYAGYSIVVALQAKGSYSRGMLDMSGKLRLILYLTAKGVRNMLYFAYTAKHADLNTLLSLYCCRVCSSHYTTFQLVFCAHLISFDLNLDLV